MIVIVSARRLRQALSKLMEAVDTYLFLSEVKLAQLFPQMPVLTEHVQSGCGLAQVDDVRGI